MDVELARTGTHIFAEHLRHSCHVIGLAHHGEVVGELLFYSIWEKPRLREGMLL